jgi:hypothetical protein
VLHQGVFVSGFDDLEIRSLNRVAPRMQQRSSRNGRFCTCPIGMGAVLFCIGKEINMTPQTKSAEQEDADEIRLQEEYVRQVEDHSRPAQEVLTDQLEGCAPNEAPVLFVP